jgi:hypothetical protein
MSKRTRRALSNNNNDTHRRLTSWTENQNTQEVDASNCRRRQSVACAPPPTIKRPYSYNLIMKCLHLGIVSSCIVGRSGLKHEHADRRRLACSGARQCILILIIIFHHLHFVRVRLARNEQIGPSRVLRRANAGASTQLGGCTRDHQLESVHRSRGDSIRSLIRSFVTPAGRASLMSSHFGFSLCDLTRMATYLHCAAFATPSIMTGQRPLEPAGHLISGHRAAARQLAVHPFVRYKATFDSEALVSFLVCPIVCSNCQPRWLESKSSPPVSTQVLCSTIVSFGLATPLDRIVFGAWNGRGLQSAEKSLFMFGAAIAFAHEKSRLF